MSAARLRRPGRAAVALVMPLFAAAVMSGAPYDSLAVPLFALLLLAAADLALLRALGAAAAPALFATLALAGPALVYALLLSAWFMGYADFQARYSASGAYFPALHLMIFASLAIIGLVAWITSRAAAPATIAALSAVGGGLSYADRTSALLRFDLLFLVLVVALRVSILLTGRVPHTERLGDAGR